MRFCKNALEKIDRQSKAGVVSLLPNWKISKWPNRLEPQYNYMQSGMNTNYMWIFLTFSKLAHLYVLPNTVPVSPCLSSVNLAHTSQVCSKSFHVWKVQVVTVVVKYKKKISRTEFTSIWLSEFIFFDLYIDPALPMSLQI